MSYLPPDEAKSLLAGMLVDALEGPNPGKYLTHVGFDLAAIQDSSELLPAWFGHYRIEQGTYDIDRAAMDLATYPPVARAIFMLQQEQRAKSLAT